MSEKKKIIIWLSFSIILFVDAEGKTFGQETIPEKSTSFLIRMESQKSLLDEDVYTYITARTEIEYNNFYDAATPIFQDSKYTAFEKIEIFADATMKKKLNFIEKGRQFLLLQISSDRMKAFISMSSQKHPVNGFPLPLEEYTGWADCIKISRSLKKTVLLERENVKVELMNPYIIISYKTKTYFYKNSLHMFGPYFVDPKLIYTHYLLMPDIGWDAIGCGIFDIKTGRMEFYIGNNPEYSPQEEVFFSITYQVIGYPVHIQVFESTGSELREVLSTKINGIANGCIEYKTIWISDNEFNIDFSDCSRILHISKRGSKWVMEELLQ